MDLGVEPDPRVAHGDPDGAGVAGPIDELDRHVDATPLGEGHRVVDEVLQHAAKLRPVAEQQTDPVVHLLSKRNAFGRRRCREGCDHLADDRARAERRDTGIGEPAGTGGAASTSVEDRQQVLSGVAEFEQPPSLLVGQVVVQHERREPQHPVERRAKLVRHVGQVGVPDLTDESAIRRPVIRGGRSRWVRLRGIRSGFDCPRSSVNDVIVRRHRG